MTASSRFFAVALGLGVLLRVFFLLLAWADPSILAHSDQLIYIRLADELLAGSGLGTGFGVERLPLYPLFLALCGLVAPGGAQVVGAVGEHALLLAVAVQNVLGLCAVYFLYRAGRLVGPVVGNLAGAFAALNLNMAVYSSQILTDSLFYPLFTAGLLALLAYRAGGRKRDLALFAAILGACTLVRSVTMYLPLFVVAYLLVERSGARLVERGRRVAVFCVVFAALLVPWLVRNHALYGHAKLTSQGQAHISGWVIPGIAQYEEGLDLGAATAKYTEQWRQRVEAMPEPEREDVFARDAEAKRWFGEYLASVSPVSVAQAWFWGAVKNLFTPVSVELAYIFKMEWTHFYDTPGASFPEQAYNFVFHNENRLYAMLLIAGIGLTLALRAVQLGGMWRMWRVRPAMLSVCVLVTAYFLAVSGPVGYAKYRLPYEGVFVLLTAFAAAALPVFRREAGSGDGRHAASGAGGEAGGAAGHGAFTGTVLRTVLGGGCVMYALWGVEVADMGRALGALAPAGVALAVVALVVDYLFMGLRMRLISGGRVDFAQGFNAVLLGVGLNNVFPAKLGEAAKTMYLCRRGDVPLGQGLGWVFWERFADLNLLVVLAALAVAATGSGLFAWPVALGVAGLWCGLLLLARWQGFAELAVRLMPIAGLKNLVREVAAQLRGGMRPGYLLAIGLAAAAVWAAYYLQYVALLRVAGGLDLTWGQMLAVFVMAAGGMALPSTPGGVGVYEAVMVAALAVYGVPREEALALGLVYHVLMYVPSTLYGLAVLARTGFGLRELRAARRDDEPTTAEAENA